MSLSLVATSVLGGAGAGFTGVAALRVWRFGPLGRACSLVSDTENASQVDFVPLCHEQGAM